MSEQAVGTLVKSTSNIAQTVLLEYYLCNFNVQQPIGAGNLTVYMRLIPGHVSKTEDASSEVSYGSFAYSDLEQCFGNNGGYDSSPEGGPGNPDFRTERHNTTLCPRENQISESSVKWNGLVDPLKGKSSSGLRKLSKVRSFMDIRTQLLQRALLQGLNKRRGAKTVGAVENIGFHDPS